MVEVQQLATQVGTARACCALAAPRSSMYRLSNQSTVPKAPSQRPKPKRALAPQKRMCTVDVLHSDGFSHKAPRHVCATLLDEWICPSSIPTMSRLLEEAQQVCERRDQLRHPKYKKPELLATRPKKVWSWNITKLLGPVTWTYFCRIADVSSRYVLGWMVAAEESAALPTLLIEETSINHGIKPGRLTLHADRGNSVESKAVPLLLADLHVTKTLSRPYTSTSNSYSEPLFKATKYRRSLPYRFGSNQQPVAFCRAFSPWHDRQHRHSGIRIPTPETLHYGEAKKMINVHGEVQTAPYLTHLRRFVKGTPVPQPVPAAAWIDPPKPNSQSEGLQEMVKPLGIREVVLPGATQTVVPAHYVRTARLS